MAMGWSNPVNVSGGPQYLDWNIRTTCEDAVAGQKRVSLRFDGGSEMKRVRTRKPVRRAQPRCPFDDFCAELGDNQSIGLEESIVGGKHCRVVVSHGARAAFEERKS